ncbi:MAG: phenylalanine--tRNA ligase subunit beta [Spirochaetales bacterium]
MPKIELYRNALDRFVGERLDRDSLEEQLTVAKAEIDEWENDEGLVKIELNDTNRPDLWSTAGLGRQLRIYRGGQKPSYDFFSTPESPADTGNRVITVDADLAARRPFIVGFIANGKEIDDATLADMIQTQEKLCWNFGQKRKAVAMGIYRSDLIRFPVRYQSADPDSTRFVPLGEHATEQSLREIIANHPKGEEFGHIVSGFDRMPFLSDASGEPLSFPPVINSARLGAVETGDSQVFVEMTGTDHRILMLSASIVACDLSDAGFEILPVRTEYPYDTPFGRSVVSPLYFQVPVEVDVSFVSRWLGVEFTAQEALQALARMGVRAEVSGTEASEPGSVLVHPPEYRNDFLHPVDIAEDIMIGRGMHRFEPEALKDFTVGRLTAVEELSREVKSLLVGLGYQEFVFNYLGSKRDYRERMLARPLDSDEPIDTGDMVRVENPMSENFEFIRPSVLPSLLSVESGSANAVYPHKSFEIGKVASRDDSDVTGTRTDDMLGLLASDADVTFNTIRDQLHVLLYFLNVDYELAESDDQRFLPGRRAEVMAGGRSLGVIGEVHPQVLENWGVEMPCAACEIDVRMLMER